MFARTKEESNPEKDKEMNDVAEKGTSVVLSESFRKLQNNIPINTCGI